MAIIVQTNTGYDLIKDGVTGNVDATGHLTILDGNGWFVAAYPAHTWEGASLEGQRTEVDANGKKSDFS